MAFGLPMNVTKQETNLYIDKAYTQSSQFSHPTFDAQIFQSSCLYSLTDLKQVS